MTQEQVKTLFDSSDPMDYVIAARKAPKFGLTFVEQLLNLLNHPFYENRSYSAKALGEITYAPAIPQIIPLLQDDMEEVRFSAAEALGYFTHTDVITPLLEALADHSRETRRLATLSLTKQKESEVIDRINAWLQNLELSDYDMEDEIAIHKVDVARGIMEACAELEAESVIDILSFGLTSPDLEMQRLTAISVGQHQLHLFGPRILELQHHEDDDLRLAAIYALTQLDIDNKKEVLLQHVDDTYEFVRETLAEYLPQEYEELDPSIINSFAGDEVPFVRSALARGCTTNQYLEVLGQLLKDPNPYVRTDVIKSLVKVNDSSAALALLQELEEEDELVQIALDNAIADLSTSQNL